MLAAEPVDLTLGEKMTTHAQFSSTAPVKKIFSGATSQKIIITLLAVSMAICVLYRGAFILFSKYSLLAFSIEDDSFYYLLPAWNLHAAGMFTFDGHNSTYGFQPLWMLFLSILAKVCQTREIFLRTTLMVQLFMYLLTGILLAKFLVRRRGVGYFLLGLIIFFFFNVQMIQGFTSGKENTLHALLLVTFLMIYDAFCQAPANRKIVIGIALSVVLGLVSLTRVNGMALSGAFGLVHLIYFRRQIFKALSTIVLVLTGSVLVCLPWFVYAMNHLGSWFPTSGSAKLAGIDLSTILHHLMTFDTVKNLYVYLHALPFSHFKQTTVLLLGTALLLFLSARSRRFPSLRFISETVVEWFNRYPGLMVLVIYSAANHLATSLLLRDYFIWGYWYHVPEQMVSIIVLSLFIGFALDQLTSLMQQRRPWGLALAGMLCSIGLYFVGVFIFYAGSRLQRMKTPVSMCQLLCPLPVELDQAIEWTKANLPKHSRIGAWNAGIAGYLLEDYQVFNLDGLANSRDFLKVMNDNEKLCQWMQAQGIKYILDTHVINPPQRDYWPRLLGKYEVLYSSGMFSCEQMVVVSQVLALHP
jgi:hypothetical protein